MLEKYEAVIGLEVHVELATDTKIFCRCKNAVGQKPNSCVCPVCMGLPGSMPTLNRRVCELAVRAGLATDCQIADYTRFDRKNYFYPDLPKAYQISQNEYPICKNGKINIGRKQIGIERIHMEEDAGKLMHGGEQGTLVDYNRCGVPLIEIVSRPDIRTSAEARDYLSELRLRLIYAGVSECKMQLGQLRCDVNLSVRKRGDRALGVRTEIKNINSFAFVARAIEYEFERQVSLLETGEQIRPETRRFDADSGKTLLMRAKESASDYRFFPEPDLPAFGISRAYVERVRGELPPMPNVRRERYVNEYGLRAEDAEIIVCRPTLALYFDEMARHTQYKRMAASVLISELLGKGATDSFECVLPPCDIAELVTLYGEQVISSSTLKKVLSMMLNGEGSPRDIVQKHNLSQISDRAYIAEVLQKVIEENPKLLSDYLGGKLAAKKAIVGKVMSYTKGRANPLVVEAVWNAREDS